MDFDLSDEQQGCWFEYDYDPEPDPAKRLAFLILPRTPLVEDTIRRKAITRPVVNGRFRRQFQDVDFNSMVYEREKFVACCQGWRNLYDKKTGEPLPCTEENRRKLSMVHTGAVNFVNDIADALGELNEEQVRDERAKFRGVVEVQNRPPERELPHLSDSL
jgi:hypothetical protein